MPAPPPPARPWTRPRSIGCLSATVAALLVIGTLGDPGITSDEPIDTKVGTNYLRATSLLLDRFSARGPGSIGLDQLDALYRDNAQHPPLGRWLLGFATFAAPLEPLLGGADPFSVHSARLAPALAFAALIGLLASWTTRRYGPIAGASAAASLVFFPRSFAHAHFATLDTFLSLFWTLSLLTADSALGASRPVRRMSLAGLAWGLALLTKIQAVLLPPLVLLSGLLRLRNRPRILLAALSAWTAVGLAVFWLGWPWLWHDTFARLSRFLGTSTERSPTLVYYLGQVYPDRQVPWHYPWVQFGLSVPVGLHVLALLGLYQGGKLRRSDPTPLVLAASVLQFLLLFSTTAPVYDNERLFLHVYPAWALLAGLGFSALWTLATRRSWRVALLIAFLAQGFGTITYHPVQLSYFNFLLAGVSGAEKTGLEVTYWGDSIDQRLMKDVESLVQPGDRVAVAPSLHHLYPIAHSTETLLEKGVTLLPEQDLATADWLLVFRREPYLRPEVRASLDLPAAASNSRRGVWLARLIRLKPPTTPTPD